MRRTVDPEGRVVVLTEERWAHIADDQPGFKPRPGAVLPGDPSSFGVAETAVDFDESPEGHHTREDGVIVVTLPGRRLELRDLGDVLPVACCQK